MATKRNKTTASSEPGVRHTHTPQENTPPSTPERRPCDPLRRTRYSRQQAAHNLLDESENERTRLEVEVNRLRLENEDLKSR
jgi:hypothetical protein